MRLSSSHGIAGPCAAVLAAVLSAVPAARAQDVTRVPIPNSHFPIAAAVEVPAGLSTVYVSGMGADVADPKAPAMTRAAYGNTQTQTVSALRRIGQVLAGMKLGLGDVVQMHVYLAADAAMGGKLDFAGFMKGYTQFFGTAQQPRLPARAAFQVAALVNPGWLVEIEVTAVRPAK